VTREYDRGVSETHPDLLIGDAERTATIAELRGNYDAGRLTLEEFETRLAEVHAARTGSDLAHSLRQLPDTKRPTLSPRDRRWRSLAAQYLVANVVVNLVWLFTGAQGDYWPRWVLLATLIMFVRRVLRPGRHGVHHLPPPSEPPQLSERAQSSSTGSPSK
jgi:hypothetical protein